jgi:hypothetical protein
MSQVAVQRTAAALGAVTTIVTDFGTATPIGGIIDIFGGGGASTSASGNIITITAGGGLTFHTDSGDANPAANAITVAGGIGCSTTGSGSTITVNVDSVGSTWIVNNNASITLAAGDQFICQANSAISFPASPAIGDTYALMSGSFPQITFSPTATQYIVFNESTITSPNVLTSPVTYNCIKFVCVGLVASFGVDVYQVDSFIGNWNIT